MYWVIVCGALVTLLAAAALGFHLGYVWGWNDRGIKNRARRAQAEHAELHRTRWETKLLDQARIDREWEDMLAQWAREAHTEARGGMFETHELPAIPRLADTGPQEIIA